MYKLTDTFVLILLIFAVFLSVAYTTLNKLFAVFYILSREYVIAIFIHRPLSCKRFCCWTFCRKPHDCDVRLQNYGA